MENTNDYIQKIIPWLEKNLFYIKNELVLILAVFFTFITPIKGLFYIVGSAVLIDTFYAIYASIIINGIRSIESNKLFNSVVKTFFYMGTILLAYLCSVYIMDGKTFDIEFLIPKAVCVLWLLIETKSIDETNIKLGNRSFLTIIKDTMAFLKTFKKDINELSNK